MTSILLWQRHPAEFVRNTLRLHTSRIANPLRQPHLHPIIKPHSILLMFQMNSHAHKGQRKGMMASWLVAGSDLRLLNPSLQSEPILLGTSWSLMRSYSSVLTFLLDRLARQETTMMNPSYINISQQPNTVNSESKPQSM